MKQNFERKWPLFSESHGLCNFHWLIIAVFLFVCLFVYFYFSNFGRDGIVDIGRYWSLDYVYEVSCRLVKILRRSTFLNVFKKFKMVENLMT